MVKLSRLRAVQERFSKAINVSQVNCLWDPISSRAPVSTLVSLWYSVIGGEYFIGSVTSA
jgi:hypothetical protein